MISKLDEAVIYERQKRNNVVVAFTDLLFNYDQIERDFNLLAFQKKGID